MLRDARGELAGPDAAPAHFSFGRDRARPLLQRGDREQVLRDLAVIREPLYAEVADLMLDTDSLSPGAATSTLAHLLATHWQRSERAA